MPNFYKYIDRDIDRDDLVANLRHNVGNYVSSRGWSEDKQQEFMNAYNNYLEALENGNLSTGDFHQLIDDTGALDNGSSNYRDYRRSVNDPKGRYLQTPDEYKRLGKHKQKRYVDDFYANREVANYFDNIAKNIYNKERSQDVDFDPTADYGLWQHFVNSGYGMAKNDFKDWDLYDKEKGGYTTNEGRARQFAKYIRNNYIPEFLGEDLIKTRNLKFSGPHWKNKEAYIDELNKLADYLDKVGDMPNVKNFADRDDFRQFAHLFSGNTTRGRNQMAQVKDFFGLGLNDHDRAEAAAAAAAAESGSGDDGSGNEGKPAEPANPTEDDLRNTRPDQINELMTAKYNPYVYDISNNTLNNDEALYNTVSSNINDNNVLSTLFEPLQGNANATDRATLNALLANNQEMAGRWLSTYEDVLNRRPDYNLLNFGFSNGLNGWRYDRGTFNPNNFSVFAYRPTENGGIQYGFMDLPSIYDWNNRMEDDSWFTDPLTELWRQRQAAEAKRRGGVFKRRRGGVFKWQEGAEIPEKNAVLEKNANLTAYELAKRSSEETKAESLRRAPWKKGTDYSDNEFTAADKARIASIAADVGTMFLGGPAAAAAGVGSSFANLYADIKDGVGAGATIGRFAAGLGLSALSVIPVLGGALKGGRIIKTLVNLAPKLTKTITLAASAGVLANAPEILKSFQKIGKKGVENELSIRDWRNIATGLMMAVGGTKAAGRAYAKKAALKGNVNQEVQTFVAKNSAGERKLIAINQAEDQALLNRAKQGKLSVTDESRLNTLKSKNASTLSQTEADELAALTNQQKVLTDARDAAAAAKPGKLASNNVEAEMYAANKILESTNSYKDWTVETPTRGFGMQGFRKNPNAGRFQFWRRNYNPFTRPTASIMHPLINREGVLAKLDAMRNSGNLWNRFAAKQVNWEALRLMQPEQLAAEAAAIRETGPNGNLPIKPRVVPVRRPQEGSARQLPENIEFTPYEEIPYTAPNVEVPYTAPNNNIAGYLSEGRPWALTEGRPLALTEGRPLALTEGTPLALTEGTPLLLSAPRPVTGRQLSRGGRMNRYRDYSRILDFLRNGGTLHRK